MIPLSFEDRGSPTTIVRHSVWLCAEFTLSYRDVEEMLPEYGVNIS